MMKYRRHHKNSIPKKRRIVDPTASADGKKKKKSFREKGNIETEELSKKIDYRTEEIIEEAAPLSAEQKKKKRNVFAELLESFDTKDEEDMTESSEDEIDTVKDADKFANLVAVDHSESDKQDEEEGDDPEEVDDDIQEDAMDTFVLHLDTQIDQKYVSSVVDVPQVETHEVKGPALGNILLKKKSVELLPEAKRDCKLPLSKGIEHFKIREAVKENFLKVNNDKFTGFQSELLSIFNRYHDFLYTNRHHSNADALRNVYCLHALNHVLKTRQLIMKHNAKRNSKLDTNSEYRDQGFTRPKVMFLLPFRNSAYKVVNTLLALLFGRNDKVDVLNLKRFQEEFKPTDDSSGMIAANKPEDFQTTFSGNIDDSFRLGLSVTKKSIRLYTDFYSSDIVIFSPLALRMVIGAEGDRERDFDFLSSLEVVILDEADVFLMQNWEHVIHIMNHANIQPREARGVDFSRVHLWLLEGYSKYYRQLLVFSSTTSNEITAFYSKEAKSYEGQVTLRNPAAVEQLRHIFVKCPQVFRRFECSSISDMPEARFQFFINKVLPTFKEQQIGHVLIYISSYFDFVRLRNYFRSEELDFTQICEYTKDGKVAQSRSLFFHSSRNFMLFTERFHFYHRYKVKGIRHIIFYQLPTFPQFYSELCNLMHPSYQGKKFIGDESSMSATAIFSQYDAALLANILGNDKAAKLLRAPKDRSTTFLSGHD